MQAPFADSLSALSYLSPTLPLLGRDDEMQLIQAVLDAVSLDSAPGPRALTVSGEIGVGKTRLLTEACLAARKRGFLVLDACAQEACNTFPYFPFVQALRQLLHTSQPEQLSRYFALTPTSLHATIQQTLQDDVTISLQGPILVAALGQLFPELLTQFQVQPATEPLSAEQEKFRLLEAIATFLAAISLDQPVLLCIDNLQWADSASLELMLYLTVRLRSCRVVLLGATRPPGNNENRTETALTTKAAAASALQALADLLRHQLLLLLPLAPLDAEAASLHLQALLPYRLSQDSERALLTRAEGNPFFLEELVRTVNLTAQAAPPAAPDILHSPLPESLTLAITQRLQALSTNCRALLQVAALVGRSFSADVLLEVLEQTAILYALRACSQALLHEAIQAAIIVRVPDTAVISTTHGELAAQEHLAQKSRMPGYHIYTFCQGIVQEVLQQGISKQQARILHTGIGQALEMSYAYKAPEHAAQLAHHYAAGNLPAATIRWSLLAGEEASGKQAQREAIAHFQRVLHLLAAGETCTTISALQLHLVIGELWFKLGEFEPATQAFQHALEQFQLTDVPPLLQARTNRLISDIYRMQGKYDLAIAHLQAAQAALNEHGTADGKVAAVQVSWLTGRIFPQTTESPQRASVMERILFFQARGLLNLFLNQKEDSEAAFWTSHELATGIGDRGCQAFALHMLGWLRGWGEQLHEALRLQEQAHALYIAVGDPFHAALGDQGLGIIYQTLGEMERARQHTLRGFERAHRYGVRRILGWLHWNNAVMALHQGSWESCASHLQLAYQEACTYNDTRLTPVVLQAQAVLGFRQGHWREAEALFQEALQASINTEWQPGTMALYGHFLAMTGQRVAALAQLKRAADFPEPPGFAGDFYIPFLAEGYLHLASPALATSYINRIQHQRGFMYYGTLVNRILGKLALLNEDWETAECAFAEGLLFCKRAHNEPEEAAILYEQARMTLMRGGSMQHVNTLCIRARVLFLQYALPHAAGLVDTLLEGVAQLSSIASPLPAANPPPQKLPALTHNTSPIHLTRRELEVLCLVARGYTDREVAELLVISPRTTNRHLSNIFDKLDVPGRAAAVAYAVRQGLV